MATNAIQEVKRVLSADEIKARFNDILGAKAPQFMASITNAVAGNQALKECDPNSIISAAFIAASLDLPIDPNLGRSYIIPYGKRAQFQVGYKGFIELALRTGEYKSIHATEIYEDELVSFNPIENELVFVNDFSKCTQRNAGQTDKIIGYYAKYVLLRGSTMSLYMTKQQIINHAQRYSVMYQRGKKDSPWFTNFDEMAKKTVIKRLLTKYGMLSVEMQKAVVDDQKTYDNRGNGDYGDNQPEPDALAEDVIKEIAETVEQPVEVPAEKTVETLADDFAAFEENFNIPDDGLPFN